VSGRTRIGILSAFAAICAAALLTGSSAAWQRTVPHMVYFDGDSLAVGTSWYLSAFLPGWTLRETAEVSRHASQGVLAVESRGKLLERVVVLDLGTNDDPSAVARFRRYVKDVLRAAGPSRCVIWSTINRPPYNGVSYDGYNAVLASLDRANANLRVFDWAGMAKTHPQWFGSDGVHPTNTGYRQRAAALARLIKRC